MEIHLETDAQIKAPPPCIVDDYIRDRVSCLKRQFKITDTLVHPGDIVLQAGVLALTGQHLDILQNLLQNALETCEKVSESERFIVLTGKRKGRFFLIEVKNSFVGEVVFGQDGLPATTKKEDVPMHGIGLSNGERAAKTAALEKTFSNIGDLLKTRMLSAPAITPEVSLPSGTNMFFLNM